LFETGINEPIESKVNTDELPKTEVTIELMVYPNIVEFTYDLQ
jgi:hypothetical protein